jgi:cytochrome c-type biogenesis protein CcmH
MILMLLILLVPLVLLLLWPVWFREPVAVQSNENRRLYQERTAELAVSDWSEDEKAAFQLELDREFLASDGDTVQSELNRTVHSSSPMLVAVVLVLSAAMTLGLYQLWGASGELRAAELLDQGEKTELTTLERTELMHLLGQATQRYPEQLEWAYLNARLLSAAGDYQQAVEVFEFILSALPEEATADRAATLTLTAEARFFCSRSESRSNNVCVGRTGAVIESRQSSGIGARWHIGL